MPRQVASTPTRPTPELPLRGKCIWLTRPEDQAGKLERALQGQGATTCSLPLLEIVPVPPDAETRELLQALDQYDLAIYISVNAARIGLQTIERFWFDYPPALQNFAIGPATAKVLREKGLQVRAPARSADSESLLKLPQLQQVVGKRALIIRGVGGMETLAQGLRERGCTVDYAEVYGRLLPAYAPPWLQEKLEEFPPDAIVISSAEAMDNLKTLFSNWYVDWATLPLFVSSERLAAKAAGIGFKRVVTMVGATDTRFVKGLQEAFAFQGSAGQSGAEKAR